MKNGKELNVVPFVNSNHDKARRERERAEAEREIRAGNRKAFIYGILGIVGFLIIAGGLGTIEIGTFAAGLPAVGVGSVMIAVAVALTNLTT